MVVKFYFHPQSPSAQTAWMVLKELGVDFEPVEINLWSDKECKEELLKVNPRGTVPAIKDGEVSIGESRAIAIYLCRKYEDPAKPNKLYPTDVGAAAWFDMELFVDLECIAAVQHYLNVNDVFSGRGKGPFPEHLENVKKYLTNVEVALAKHDYLAGDHLTVLDLCKLCMLGMLDIAAFANWDEFPRVVAWRKRMAELPYYEECHVEGLKENIAMYKRGNEKYAKAAKKFC